MTENIHLTPIRLVSSGIRRMISGVYNLVGLDRKNPWRTTSGQSSTLPHSKSASPIASMPTTRWPAFFKADARYDRPIGGTYEVGELGAKTFGGLIRATFIFRALKTLLR